jgi:hypothetical protein
MLSHQHTLFGEKIFCCVCQSGYPCRAVPSRSMLPNTHQQPRRSLSRIRPISIQTHMSEDSPDTALGKLPDNWLLFTSRFLTRSYPQELSCMLRMSDILSALEPTTWDCLQHRHEEEGGLNAHAWGFCMQTNNKHSLKRRQTQHHAGEAAGELVACHTKISEGVHTATRSIRSRRYKT